MSRLPNRILCTGHYQILKINVRTREVYYAQKCKAFDMAYLTFKSLVNSAASQPDDDAYEFSLVHVHASQHVYSSKEILDLPF